MAKIKGPASGEREVSALDLSEIYNAESLNPALERIYAEMGVGEDGRASYVVAHKMQDDGAEARIWRGAADEYDLDTLAKRFGSGEYIVRVYVQSESGRYVCRGSKTFRMLLDPAEDERIKLQREGKLSATGNAQGPDFAQLLAAQQKALADTLAPIIASLGNRQNLMSDMKAMAEIFTVARPPVDTAKPLGPMEMLQLFGQFKGILDGLKPEKPLGEDEIGPNTMLMKGIELLGNVIQQAKSGAQMQKPAEAPQTISLPAAQQPPVLPAAPPKSNGEDDMKIAIMLFLRAAAANDDVEKWAERVADDATDDVIDALHLPDWFAQLCIIEPKCAPYQEWITKVRNRVVELLKGEPLPPENPLLPETGKDTTVS